MKYLIYTDYFPPDYFPQNQQRKMEEMIASIIRCNRLDNPEELSKKILIKIIGFIKPEFVKLVEGLGY